jgi:lipopolysaccharide transport system ATP-binding protein
VATHLLPVEGWPERLPAGARWRVAFDIAAQLCFGEYSINLGLAELPPAIYRARAGVSPEEIANHLSRVGRIHRLTSLAIVPDVARVPTVLPHHGLAYLACQVIRGRGDTT